MSEETEKYQNFGPCCACEKDEGEIKNIVMLNQKGPMSGKGWGCLVCGLPPEGAVASLCDECMELGRPIKYAIADFETKARVPIESLGAEHDHDWSKHPEDKRP
jgi:hypothetical protein